MTQNVSINLINQQTIAKFRYLKSPLDTLYFYVVVADEMVRYRYECCYDIPLGRLLKRWDYLALQIMSNVGKIDAIFL